MKILQINAVNRVASTGRTVWEMNEYLNENGHNCVSAYSKGPSVNNKEYFIGNLFDAKIHALLSRINGKQASFSIFSTVCAKSLEITYLSETSLLSKST